ncbi:MAG: OadG family protein [Rikenellaceae bacterium]|jgi:Na+-transporting methylmalonyl-CoA/oxaloacetate decarboxylase gamma subunit|nr:OadG family protein [Rikenellaceae bacterium]
MRRILTILVLCAGALQAFGDGLKDIRINEFMVINQDNYVDPYGHRIGWIELHNTGHSKVDVAGCFLSIDPSGNRAPEMTYRIPPHDERTVIPPLGYLIFFCDGTATKGTFHTNFTLDKTGYISFTDASSKGVPISEVEYKVGEQKPDVSMGYELIEGKLTYGMLSRTTPMATNDMDDPVPQHERFRQMDPHGYVMAISAMAVVFSALALLYILFKWLGKLNTAVARRRSENAKNAELLARSTKTPTAFAGEAEIAAIAMALHEFKNELHDKQSTVLTINRTARSYSPWSSKIYGLRQTPNRIPNKK